MPCNASSWWERSGLPATGMSAFGLVRVKGYILVLFPALSITACISLSSFFEFKYFLILVFYFSNKGWYFHKLFHSKLRFFIFISPDQLFSLSFKYAYGMHA